MNDDELKIIKLLKDTREILTPPKSTLEKLLLNMDNEDVTKEEFPRYSYSNNMWKFAIPIFLVAIVLIGVIAYKNYSGSPISNPLQQLNQPSQTSDNNQIPQTVTSQNEDNTLNQTDTAINQSMDQLDKDLKDVDAAQSQQEDPNSI